MFYSKVFMTQKASTDSVAYCTLGQLNGETVWGFLCSLEIT